MPSSPPEIAAMTITIDATYEDGVLKPAHPLPLAERAQVRVTVQPVTLAGGEQTTWPCKAGSAKDKILWIAPDFDAPLEDFREYME
jgi:predicted DNA-binding antitoxin AbrB/MazE fold protein